MGNLCGLIPNGQQELKSEVSMSIKEISYSTVQIKDTSMFKDYEQGDMIGQGAFGQVYLVKHRVAGLVRAAKYITKMNLDEKAEKDLLREVSIMSAFDHPNIIKLFDAYQDNQNYYIIMEYCDGGELFDRIKSMEEFSERTAANYMKEILSAVNYIHQKGCVHRDIKPENLIFDNKKHNSNLKIIDFGTSKRYDPNKYMKKKVGTPYYIAPEVIKMSYNEKCDVWSCGIILYILLCGYPPFNGDTDAQIFQAVRRDKLKFDEEEWDNISQEAKNLISKMLDRNVAKRVSAQEAFDDPWIQGQASQKPLNKKILHSMGNFIAHSKLKNAIVQYIGTHIVPEKEKEQLLNSFQALDENGDGYLSREELLKGYMQVYNDKKKAEGIVSSVLYQIGCTNQEQAKVKYSDFIMIGLDRELICNKEQIAKAFKIFDQNGDGFIEKKELEIVFGKELVNDESWNEIVKECGLEKKGYINQDELFKVIQMLSTDQKSNDQKINQNVPVELKNKSKII